MDRVGLPASEAAKQGGGTCDTHLRLLSVEIRDTRPTLLSSAHVRPSILPLAIDRRQTTVVVRLPTNVVNPAGNKACYLSDEHELHYEQYEAATALNRAAPVCLSSMIPSAFVADDLILDFAVAFSRHMRLPSA
jgi:hypothetical protein